MAEDWLSRVVIPDLYPRREDPLRPAPATPPDMAPPASFSAEAQIDPVLLSITQPSSRPVVYQEAINYALTVGTTAVPILNTTFPVDAILISVPSSGANSVFFGRGTSINTVSGSEITPGSPTLFRVDNTRELWEVQRLLEFIAAMLANDRGARSIPTFRAPRVVMDASDYALVAGVAGVVASIMLFYVPEKQ
jgi:hypothetical protein